MQPGFPGAPGAYVNQYGQEIDPETGQPLSDKTQMVAGLLSLFLGNFGAGRWYTGHTGLAIGQLLTCGGCGIWAMIDGIMLLANGGEDGEGRKLRKS